LIDESLLVLKKDRDREVVAKRHGLKNYAPHTLEQIGSELGITRERVRQIEKSAFGKIREQGIVENDLHAAIIASLQETGGIMRLKRLLESLELDEQMQPNLTYLVRIMPDLDLIEHNDQLAPVVAFAEVYGHQDVLDLHSQLHASASAQGRPVKFEKIVKAIDGPHTRSTLEELAIASKLITQLDGHWGLVSWPEVNPRSIRDKTYLVLKKSGRPMHFTEIADKISRLDANPKQVTTQAVHNELIKDSRFVLIGRGIYALAEWGYQAGTVADIIEQILREQSPLAREEIIKRVLARRQVKVATIALNLQEKPQFERVGKGLYKLQDGFVAEPRKRRGRRPNSR
jgi:DNA-directed RNA polymerase delta subunit